MFDASRSRASLAVVFDIEDRLLREQREAAVFLAVDDSGRPSVGVWRGVTGRDRVRDEGHAGILTNVGPLRGRSRLCESLPIFIRGSAPARRYWGFDYLVRVLVR